MSAFTGDDRHHRSQGSSLCRLPPASGRGKWGGARVIYFIVRDGTIWLLIAYKKAKFDDLPVEFLARLKRSIEDG